MVPKSGFDHTDFTPYCWASDMLLHNSDSPSPGCYELGVVVVWEASTCYGVVVDTLTSEGVTGHHDGAGMGCEVSVHESVVVIDMLATSAADGCGVGPLPVVAP